MTWNQSLNVNSWYSFVIILLPRCLIVYGWQGAPCKVIRQFSRTQLPVNCGWGAESTLHCQGQPICTKNIVFSERARQCQVPKPEWDTGTIEEGMMWWFQPLHSARGWNSVPWAAHEEHWCPAYPAKGTILQTLMHLYLWEKTVWSTDMI